MKKFLTRTMFMLLFAMSFLFLGVVSVSAAASINNTQVSVPNGSSYSINNDKYYLIMDKNTVEAQVSLKAKSHAQGAFLTQIIYTAKVSVIKCEVLTNSGCDKWATYEYSSDAAKTMDKLKSTLTLNLASLSFVSKSPYPTQYNVKTDSLTSEYGLDKTYFVIVQYSQGNISASTIFGGSKEVYDAEVYKVVRASQVDSVDCTMSGVGNLSCLAGVPINTVKYFKSSTQLGTGIDFETEFANRNGVNVLDAALANPQLSTGGPFAHSFDIGNEDGYYYILVTTVGGASKVYELEIKNSGTQGGIAGGATVTTPSGNNNDNDNANLFDGVTLGQVILVALLVVLVVSVVLIIIQKIADNKKKIY